MRSLKVVLVLFTAVFEGAGENVRFFKNDCLNYPQADRTLKARAGRLQIKFTSSVNRDSCRWKNRQIPSDEGSSMSDAFCNYISWF